MPSPLSPALHVRDAHPGDLPAILEIYNDAVLNTTAIWNDATVDLDERVRWYEARQRAGYPVLVAVGEDQIFGYASYGPFRPFEGFRYSAELSIYVHPGRRGLGIGSVLLQALIDRAEHSQIHVLVAGIEAGNAASLALHERFGFVETGRMHEIGYKFGKWLDLVFMQRRVEEGRNAES